MRAARCKSKSQTRVFACTCSWPDVCDARNATAAIPSPAPLDLTAPRRLTVPLGLVTAGRTIALLGLALLVPGEAARISARL